MKEPTDRLAAEVLSFWFGSALENAAQAQARSKAWFNRDAQFDAEIAQRFGSLPSQVAEGGLGDWMSSPESALARVIVLDQFPRNLYRDDPRAFAFDAAALSGSTAAIDAGFDAQLHPLQCVFMYLPFEHAEDIRMQQRSVTLFAELAKRAPAGCEDQFKSFLDYARRHLDVIASFGRFPHRNAVLGRVSTQHELEYLASGGERFGAKSP